MKKLFAIILYISSCISVSAQDNNNYPPTGNIGFGTGSPEARLHVETPQGGKVLMGAETSYGLISLNGYKWDWNFISAAADKNLYINRPNGADIYFRHANDYNQMVLKSTGNLGIGTTDPNNSKLFLQESAQGAYGIKINNRNSTQTWGIAVDMYAVDDKIFGIIDGNSGLPRLSINASGYVGIGTTNPAQMLSVAGTVLAQRVKVSTPTTIPGDWPDYVFKNDYKLPTLEEIENYIKLNQHLPEVTSAKEVEKNGIDLGDNQVLLLKKIEEMTLLMIQQDKRIKALEKQLNK